LSAAISRNFLPEKNWRKRIKWAEEKFKTPKLFLESYPGSEINLINKENFLASLGK